MADSSIDSNFLAFDIYHVFSPDWWLHHLAAAYRDNPYHMMTELGLIILVLWLVFKHDQREELSDFDKLTVREQEALLREWEPEPLVSDALFEQAQKQLTEDKYVHLDHTNNGYIHLSSANYLAMARNPKVIAAAKQTIKKYAVGSCGPRGFYGTMDIHLNLEAKLSEYFGNSSIIYADYIGLPASVITAFAKRGDLLLIDEGCHYLITQGAILSRSNVIWFEHNNMSALERCLQTVNEEDSKTNRPLNRRFIVTEGVFSNHGDICKLNRIVELKEIYKFRLILDDSHGLGTIHAKGTPGFYNIKHSKIDMYFAGMDKALGSTGGFCIGNTEITHHQTLSGAGYVFSASAPPFQCTAAQTALELMEESGSEMIKELKEKAGLMRDLLADKSGNERWNMGYNNKQSPLIHLRFNGKIVSDELSEQYLEIIACECRKQKILVFCSVFMPQEFGISDKSDPKPSLRVVVTREHTKEELMKASGVINGLLNDVFENNGKFMGKYGQSNESVEDEKQEED